MTLDWSVAPDDERLVAGGCLARDDDGQGCGRGLVHVGAHVRTGLRAWLETSDSAGLIRTTFRLRLVCFARR